MRRVLVVSIVFLLALGAQARQLAPLDVEHDFQLLRPTVFNSEAYRLWAETHKFGGWRETGGEGAREVIIQEKGGYALHTASIVRSGATWIWTGSADFDSKEVLKSRDNALLKAREVTKLPFESLVVQPYVVSVNAADGPRFSLGWEVSGRFSRLAPHLIIDEAGGVINVQPSNPNVDGGGCGAAFDDELSEDVLHHLSIFRAAALAAAGNAINTDDVARAVAQMLSLNMQPNSGGGRQEQTWPDTAIVNAKGVMEGVCDEYAVMAVTFLRALGIRASLKFATITRNNESFSHAFVEYRSTNGLAKHLDAMFGVVDDKARYRSSGERVTVCDADRPDDARHSSVLDPIDGFLDPNTDFCLTGFSARPGYSFNP